MALRFTEQYVVDLECVFYGYHLDGAILKIAEAAYCLMPYLRYMALRFMAVLQGSEDYGD